jgi:bacterioferritin
MVTKDVFIQKLNKALEWEYAAAIQYIQHASAITGAQYDAIAEELVVHAKEEIDHAIIVSTIISDFGGVPTIEVEKREISNDSKKMLEQDLAGEELAITLYKELVTIAQELGESGYRAQLVNILVQEEEHRRDLLSSLGR